MFSQHFDFAAAVVACDEGELRVMRVVFWTAHTGIFARQAIGNILLSPADQALLITALTLARAPFDVSLTEKLGFAAFEARLVGYLVDMRLSLTRPSLLRASHTYSILLRTRSIAWLIIRLACTTSTRAMLDVAVDCGSGSPKVPHSTSRAFYLAEGRLAVISRTGL